jgi:hypothetical protein
MMSAIASLAGACSPQQRINRIVKNHPEVLVKDTIVFEDTVTFTTKRVEVDTVTSLTSISKDTLIIEKENMTIRTYYNYETDSVYIYGQCDTIYMEKIIREEILVDTIVVDPDSFMNWKDIILYILLGNFIAACIYFFIRLYLRKYPPRI